MHWNAVSILWPRHDVDDPVIAKHAARERRQRARGLPRATAMPTIVVWAIGVSRTRSPSDPAALASSRRCCRPADVDAGDEHVVVARPSRLRACRGLRPSGGTPAVVGVDAGPACSGSARPVHVLADVAITGRLSRRAVDVRVDGAGLRPTRLLRDCECVDPGRRADAAARAIGSNSSERARRSPRPAVTLRITFVVAVPPIRRRPRRWSADRPRAAAHDVVHHGSRRHDVRAVDRT